MKSLIADLLLAAWISAMVPTFGLCEATTGANLIGIATTANCTTDPAASTTIPGWTTTDGSPTLWCRTVADVAGAGAAAITPGRITNGPYGSSVLERLVDLRGGAARIDRGTATYRLSAWLGAAGAPTARATLTLIFRDAAGHPLSGSARLESPTALAAPASAARSASGAVPRGARSARVVLRLDAGTGLKRGSAYAARLGLSLEPDIAAPATAAPVSTVPRFDHVFLIMMENTSYRQVMGDATDAPFIHALAARGTLLANYTAVYHPSDENYLAVADGDTAVRGAVYFPNIHLTLRHLGDTLEAAGKTWKAYEQGMGTPCNTTTRYDKYYEPDDAPFVNFTNVIGDPARCRAHLVDTKTLASDLRTAATTPDFAWIAADDFEDGEDAGNGSPASLRAQDAWLQRTLAPLLASPAWRTQRSLLILTWDESSSTIRNHIATILVGSRGSVRRGFVSHTRYDHYSTGRTIENALGLPAFTANDAYALPINDAFVK